MQRSHKSVIMNINLFVGANKKINYNNKMKFESYINIFLFQ